MAINRVRTDEEGHKIEEVTFVDVTLWSRQAEIAGQYLKKGSSCMIDGRLRPILGRISRPARNDSKLRVVGENLQLLGSRQDSEDASSARPSRGPVSQRTAPARAPSIEPENIPF